MTNPSLAMARERDGTRHSGLHPAIEIAAAGLLALSFLVALYGQLPYHDAARFAAQVNSGQYVFDIAHIYMQPATLLWHRVLGFGESAIESQKHINSVATALAVAVFHALLVRLRITPWRRVAASLLLVASCSVMTLAPSAHMKLLAFPFVNGALYALAVVEQERKRGMAAVATLALGGLLLAVAGSLLVSALATAPFAAVAVLLVSRRTEGSWPVALGRAVVFGAACGVAALVLLAVGFVLFAHQPLSVAGLVAAVQGKADLKPASYGVLSSAARLVFGTVNNLVAAPKVGPLGRAWLTGDIPSLRPFATVFTLEAVPLVATLVLLVVIYARAVSAAVRGAACLVPLAFLAGAQAWTIYYGLNDPEHWFQLTAPTELLFLLLFSTAVVRVVLPVWTVVTVGLNLALLGVPTARYPLARYQAALSAQFTPNDLLLGFTSYSGGPSFGFFRFPGVPRLALDEASRATGSPGAFYSVLGRAIDQALARGGRVFLFAALDPGDWNAPWPDMAERGITKDALQDFLSAHYDVQPIGALAEIEAWQIKSRS